MYLKTLTLKGFKSFASSTTLRLEPGITAVVGPNGSGKSNVVDALTWVMGEQGAKNLRGGQMADVIFAGAGARPALGRAEVSLTIDNSDGALPIDYTEVTVTRTLFRGGGSEYQINGTPCRLLDVQELLSDTGLGRQMHVIIGQGRLDAVLQASDQERRAFIEEAAGVLKHRRRKERAQRKLESMAADLARLKDLTGELHRQLGPLARQAAAARRAQLIQAQVRDATARLLADDVVQVQALLQAGSEHSQQRERERDEALRSRSRSRARLEALAQLETDRAQRAAQATSTWEELVAAAQSLTTLTQVAEERLRSLQHEPPPAQGPDPDELERRAEAAQAEELAHAQAVQEATSALQRASQERRDAEAAEAEVTQRLEQARAQETTRREALARASARAEAARSRHQAAQVGLEQAERDVHEAAGRAARATRELEDYRAAHHQPSSAQEGEDAPEVGEGVGPDEHGGERAQRQAAAAHQEATEALAQARERAQEAAERRRQAGAQHATWTARRDALALSLHAQDSTEDLAQAGGEGIIGPLADYVTVTGGWQGAVAALLAERATAVLVEDDAAAATVLSLASGQGAVRMVVARSRGLVDQVPEPGSGARVPGAEPAWHVAVPSQRALGERAEAVRSLLATLLARCWVAEDLQAAQQVRELDPGASVATREGAVLAPGWAARGGQDGSSVLELAAAHEEAAEEARVAALAEEQARDELERARAQEDHARQEVAHALAALREADAQAARQAEQLARLVSAQRAAQEETERARSAAERARAHLAECVQDRERAEAALAELEREQDDQDVQARQARLAGERDQAVQAARQARARETEARLSLRTAQERQRAGHGRADSLRAAARRERAARQAAQEQARRRRQRAEVARAVRDQAQRAAQDVTAWAQEASQARQHLEEEREQARQEALTVRAEVDRASARVAELTDAAHRDEVARAEHRTRLASLAERAMSELGLEVDELVEEFGPHMPVPSFSEQDDTGGDQPQGRAYVRSEVERALARATRDLARLGKVNPLALEEHAALAERHRFLAAQLEDLSRSRADLTELIEQIDARVLEVFTQAWQDTAVQFEEVFARLFPGGQGRLTLTDPDDMLTTGIEIHARPAGKKVSRLSLLSGGERSLAAIAFLIAIFKARPSPFYVMDEVEAALDDTNLGRLLGILTELRSSSQLIVITHQKRTMEVADALYGVSMRQGVTQVVSQRLERETHAATTPSNPHHGGDHSVQEQVGTT